MITVGVGRKGEDGAAAGGSEGEDSGEARVRAPEVGIRREEAEHGE